MQTRVSTKGQIVLPKRIRQKLGLRAGDELDAGIEGGTIVLTPRRPRTTKVRVIRDPVTGLPVLSAGRNAPTLTSKEVKDIESSLP